MLAQFGSLSSKTYRVWLALSWPLTFRQLASYPHLLKWRPWRVQSHHGAGGVGAPHKLLRIERTPAMHTKPFAAILMDSIDTLSWCCFVFLFFHADSSQWGPASLAKLLQIIHHSLDLPNLYTHASHITLIQSLHPCLPLLSFLKQME